MELVKQQINYFLAQKLKKPTKNNEFSLTITIDEETESHLRTSFKITNKFQEIPEIFKMLMHIQCSSFIIRDFKFRFGNNGFNREFNLKKLKTLCIRFAKEPRINLSEEQVAFLESYSTAWIFPRPLTQPVFFKTTYTTGLFQDHLHNRSFSRPFFKIKSKNPFSIIKLVLLKFMHSN